MFYVKKGERDRFLKQFKNNITINIKFENKGSEIIFNDKDIKVFEDTIFKDNRGLLWTSWETKLSKINFKHDKFSVSKKCFAGFAL